MGHWLSAVWFPCATQIFAERTAHPGVVYDISIACENPTRDLFAEELGLRANGLQMLFTDGTWWPLPGGTFATFDELLTWLEEVGHVPLDASPCAVRLAVLCARREIVLGAVTSVTQTNNSKSRPWRFTGDPPQGGLGALGAWAGNAPCLSLPYQTCRCSLLGVLGVMLAPASPAALQQANSITRWPTGRRFRSTLVRRRFLC